MIFGEIFQSHFFGSIFWSSKYCELQDQSTFYLVFVLKIAIYWIFSKDIVFFGGIFQSNFQSDFSERISRCVFLEQYSGAIFRSDFSVIFRSNFLEWFIVRSNLFSVQFFDLPCIASTFFNCPEKSLWKIAPKNHCEKLPRKTC